MIKLIIIIGIDGFDKVNTKQEKFKMIYYTLEKIISQLY